MKTKQLLLVFILCLTSLCTFADAWDGQTTTYPDGAGTATDPIIIASAANLAYLATQEARDEFGKNLNKHFKMITDIDLQNHPWTPIQMLTGTFDGNGHKISRLNINTDQICAGLFAQVNGDGTVKNLGIESGTVQTSYNGTYNAGEYKLGGAGAIAGSMGTIEKDGGNILNCYNKATIKGVRYVGGLVGHVYIGTVVRCFNKGSVEGEETLVGGIAGEIREGSITDCYNRGMVKGNEATLTGGIVGRFFNKKITMKNNYNAAVVSSTITSQPYFTGAVCGGFADGLEPTSEFTNNYYDSQAGSFLGIGTYSSSTGVDTYTTPGYYEEGANIPPKTVQVTPKTTAELKTLASSLGSAFIDDDNNGNDGYPRLIWEPALTTNAFVIKEECKITVKKGEGIIFTGNFKTADVLIYSLNGVCIANKKIKNGEHLKLTKNLYVVKTSVEHGETVVQKVAVF